MSNSRLSYGQPIHYSLTKHITVDFLARCLLICCFHGCHESMWETEDVVKKWSKDTTVSYIIRLHNYYWKWILVNPNHIVGSTIEEQVFTSNESASAALLGSLFLLISVTKALRASVHKSNTVILSHTVNVCPKILKQFLNIPFCLVFLISFFYSVLTVSDKCKDRIGILWVLRISWVVSITQSPWGWVYVCVCVLGGLGVSALDRSRTQQLYCTTKTNTECNTAPPSVQLGNIFVCKRSSVRTCEVNSVVFGLQQVGGNLCVQLGAIFIFSSLPAWSSMGACTFLLPSMRSHMENWAGARTGVHVRIHFPALSFNS